MATEDTLLTRDPAAKNRTEPVQDFDRGTGTGQPSKSTEHLLRLMKRADDGYNRRDFVDFLDNLHGDQVVVHQIGSPITVGRPPHRKDMEMWIAACSDMRVHNDPYDVQFGQGEWTVAIGRLSGTFDGTLTLPNGKTVDPNGRTFMTFFTTIARWQNEQMVEEYVLFDPQDIMKQLGIAVG